MKNNTTIYFGAHLLLLMAFFSNLRLAAQESRPLSIYEAQFLMPPTRLSTDSLNAEQVAQIVAGMKGLGIWIDTGRGVSAVPAPQPTIKPMADSTTLLPKRSTDHQTAATIVIERASSILTSASSTITITFAPTVTAVRYVLIDQAGRQVQSGTIPVGAEQQVLDVRQLANGIYFLEAKDGLSINTRHKVVVLK